MQTKVAVSKDILKWIVTKVQSDNLPSQIGKCLNEWLCGEKDPTFNQIEKISRATGIPLGYFFLQTPPVEDLSLVEYRTMDSLELRNPSRNLIDTMYDMEQIQDWMRSKLTTEGGTPSQIVGAMKNETSPERFAKYVRSALTIQLNWFEDARAAEPPFNIIRSAISNTGVTVMMSGIIGNNTHRPLNIDEFRAFALVDDYAPLIFINANDSINGRLFSLLHEFAHICIGENSLFNDRYSTAGRVKKVETLCNAVAAEILVPQEVFTIKWGERNQEDSEQKIEELAQYFKCGITVIARKALDNNFIDFATYQRIAQKAVRIFNEKRKAQKERGDGGGDYYKTAASRIDKRFLKMLKNSVNDGTTLYSDAFRLTNTNRTTFAKLTQNVEVAK